MRNTEPSTLPEDSTELGESFENATPVSPLAFEPREEDRPVPAGVVRPRNFAPLPSPAKELPHSLDAEEFLLCCCMMPGEETLPKARGAGITPASFYDPKNSVVFSALCKLSDAGKSTEVHVVAEHLREIGQLENAGGFESLDSISRRTPTIAQAASWIETVLDLGQRRSLLRTLAENIERVQDLASPLATVTAGCRADIDRISDTSPCLGSGTTAAALCQSPLPVPPELISGVLYGGGTMMLSGPSKSRKTYTFLDLGISVATGTDWIDFHTWKTPVIYLNFELSEHSFRSRLIAICKAKGVEPPRDFHSFNLRGRTATIPMLAAELPRAIRGFGAGLVIVDPWYKISAQSGADENSNDGQARVLAEVERIVTANGAALVVGHHFAKGDASAKNSIDRAAGAGAMARWGDVIATLSEHEEPDAMALEFHLRDFAPVGKLCVRWCQPLWRRDDSLDPAKLRKVGKPESHPASELLAALSTPSTNKEWLTASEWPESTFRRKRDELLNTGKVRLVAGIYHRN